MTENNFCTKTKFKCNTCNKTFATNCGIWKHSKKYHNDNKINKINKIKNQYFCKNCKIELTSRTTRWRHEKLCTKNKPENELKQKVEQMEQTIKLLQSTINYKPEIITDSDSDENINAILIENTHFFQFNNIKLVPRVSDNYIDISQINIYSRKTF